MQMQFPSNGKRATWAHVLPFAAWVLVAWAGGEPAGWKYLARVVIGLASLLAFRPWRWYERPRLAGVPLALAVGVGVFVLWVAPECAVPSAWRDFYLQWAVMPWGEAPDLSGGGAYAPAVCGWTLTAMRLAGAAFVISIIEEFFWRGFVYRWLLGRDFTKVSLQTLHVGLFIAVAVVFGFEHHRWLVGILAGLAYGGLTVRTGSIWPAVWAHATTNLLLGGYVLATGSYAFW